MAEQQKGVVRQRRKECRSRRRKRREATSEITQSATLLEQPITKLRLI